MDEMYISSIPQLDIPKSWHPNSCDLISPCFAIIERRVQEFIREKETMEVVSLFEKYLEYKTKQNTMEVRRYIYSDEEKKCNDDPYRIFRRDNAAAKPPSKKRRAKAPDMFLAAVHYSVLRIVASRVFLVDLLKGHLLQDGYNENLMKRYTPFNESYGFRIHGVIVAVLSDVTNYSHQGPAEIQCKWIMREKKEFLEDIASLSPNGDATFTILRYCLPHQNTLKLLSETPEPEFSRLAEQASFATNMVCYTCSHELAFALSVDKQGKYHCLYCSKKKCVYMPTAHKQTLNMILDLIYAYETSNFRSTYINQREWELEVLDRFSPVIFNIHSPNDKIDESARTELISYFTSVGDKRKFHQELRHYLNMDTNGQPITISQQVPSHVRQLAQHLRNTLCPYHMRIILKTAPPQHVIKVGGTFQCSTMHLAAMLITVTSASSKDHGRAKWLLVPPSLTSKISEFLENSSQNKSLLQNIESIRKRYSNVSVVVQEEGDVVCVPPGWGYIIYHLTQSLILSVKWVETQHLHLTVLSYIYCWRPIYRKGSLNLGGQPSFIASAMSSYRHAQHIYGSTYNRSASYEYITPVPETPASLFKG